MTQPYGSGSQQPPEGQPYNPQSNPPSYSQSQSGPQQQSPQGSDNPQYGQPRQGQPYGQQNYPPQQNYSDTPPATSTATTKGRPNVGALVLAAIAAVLGVLSLFLLGWYRKDYSSVSGGNTASSNSKFSDVHDAVSKLQHLIDSNPRAGRFISFGVAPTYFSWLAYLLHRRGGRAGDRRGAAHRRRGDALQGAGRDRRRWPASASPSGPSTCSRSRPPRRLRQRATSRTVTATGSSTPASARGRWAGVPAASSPR